MPPRPLERHRLPLLLIALLTVAVQACAHYTVNTQSHTFDVEGGYRFDALSHDSKADSLFICLAFSGGGTRAAALAYGVMQQLHQTRLPGSRDKTLLDEVDCISSVSGGSFTAAYYGLFRDRLFTDFRERFLERDIQGALLAPLFNPVNWIRLASPYFSRIDIAAELYNHDLFEQRTFSALKARGRPFLMINATNLESGRRFDFTQFYFDAMGSTLEEYQVARAVAASSAFPFLLSPISLVNYPTARAYQAPGWYEGGLESRNEDLRRFHAAQDLQYYLDKRNEFIHLMDGGLSDNIGARALLEAYTSTGGFIRKRINDGVIHRLVLIVVDAKTQPQEELSRHESPPGLKEVALKTATVSLDNYSLESVALIIDDLRQRLQGQMDVEACGQLLAEACPHAEPIDSFEEAIDPYVIHVSFDGATAIEGEDPRYYLNLPTSFRLTREQVEKVVNIGPKLLTAAPQYECLLKVLHAEARKQPRPDECPLDAGLSGY